MEERKLSTAALNDCVIQKPYFQIISTQSVKKTIFETICAWSMKIIQLLDYV